MNKVNLSINEKWLLTFIRFLGRTPTTKAAQDCIKCAPINKMIFTTDTGYKVKPEILQVLQDYAPFRTIAKYLSEGYQVKQEWRSTPNSPPSEIYKHPPGGITLEHSTKIMKTVKYDGSIIVHYEIFLLSNYDFVTKTINPTNDEDDDLMNDFEDDENEKVAIAA